MTSKQWTIVACLALLSTTARISQAQDDLLQYVPSSAMGAFYTKPKEILELPEMELMPREIITAFGEKEFGIDPAEIKTLIALVDSFSDTSNPPEFSVMIQFDSPQTVPDELLRQKQMVRGDDEEWISPGPQDIIFMQPNETTIFFGNRSMISKMQSAKGAKSGLIDQIRESPPTGHFNAYVTIEPVRALIKDELPPADRVPPPFAEFLKLPDLVESITAQTSMALSGNNRFEINAVDAQSADEIAKILENGLEIGQQMILAQIAGDMRNEDESLQQAMQQYINRIGPVVRNYMKPTVEGRQLVFEMSGEDNMMASSMATNGILIGMLLPAVQQVREAARRTQAMNNLRQCTLASLNYESAYQSFPAQASYTADGKPLLSWRVHILPFIEENRLYEQFKLDEPWDSPHNIKLLDQMPEVYRGPNSVHSNKTVFLGVSGPGTVFDGKEGTKLGQIADGTSNTLMFVEVNDDTAVEWTRPTDYELNRQDPMWGVLGNRPGGFNAARCDGSVTFVSESIDVETLVNMMLKADGNPIYDYR